MKILIPLLLIASLALTFSFGAAAAVDKDVVLAISFDGLGADRDLSPHGNDGTLEKGAKRIDGKFGQAIKLSGKDYVEIKNDDSLILFRTDFTMAIWLYFDKDPPKGNKGMAGFTLIGHDEGIGGTDKWIWWYSGGAIDFHINIKDCFCGRAGSAFIDSKEWRPKLKEWYQVALVRVGNKYTHYLNGKPFGEVDDNADPTPMPKTIDRAFYIGWSEGPFFFTGRLDEILIIKRPLTQDEIVSHFKRGLSDFLSVQPHEKLSTTWGNLKAEALR